VEGHKLPFERLDITGKRLKSLFYLESILAVESEYRAEMCQTYWLEVLMGASRRDRTRDMRLGSRLVWVIWKISAAES